MSNKAIRFLLTKIRIKDMQQKHFKKISKYEKKVYEHLRENRLQ